MAKCEGAAARLPASMELQCGRQAFYGGRGFLRWSSRHPAFDDWQWKVKLSSKQPLMLLIQRQEAEHHRLMVEGKLWIAEARLRLHPPPPPVPILAHEALWECITNGAYPGAAHEGNGYNGSFTGPLGMTTPWAGHFPTGSDWVHTPVSVVYGFAEQEFEANGGSISWLEGQWPNTSPPCLGRV